MQTPFYSLRTSADNQPILKPIPSRHADGTTNDAFTTANAVRLSVAGALNRQMVRAQVGRLDASGALQFQRSLGRRLRQSPADRLRRSEVIAKGSRLDAAAEAGALDSEFLRIAADAQVDLLARFGHAWAANLRTRMDAKAIEGGAREMTKAAGIDIEKVRAYARRADANLGPAGGLVENLTAYAFKSFREPKPPLHGSDIFTIESGLNIGQLALQMLFWSMTGAAKLYDGEPGGSYDLGAPGVTQETLNIVHFLSESSLNFIEEAREEVMMLQPVGMRQENGRWAHELLHNQLMFGTSQSIPQDLPLRALLNYPGLRVAGNGFTTSTLTGQQWYNTCVDAVRRPTERSNQAFEVKKLAMSVGFYTLGTKLRMTDGDAKSALSAFREAFPEIEIVQAWELKDLIASTTEAVFGYPGQGDANPIYLRSPMMVLPQFSDGLSIKLRQHSASAGVFIASPVGAELRYITRS